MGGSRGFGNGVRTDTQVETSLLKVWVEIGWVVDPINTFITINNVNLNFWIKLFARLYE